MNISVKFLSLALACSVVANASIAHATGPQPMMEHAPAPFTWKNATIYFLLTDRFYNGNPDRKPSYGRKSDAAPLRGFLGGDLAGVTAKIKAGYFDDLGVDVIWITPPVEQIHGATDEGSGKSYGFHGYWARDWTRIDANLGTEADMQRLVETAHAHGIRVLLDVVMNHTGPVTAIDPVWPDAWVRTGPPCTYKSIETTVSCTLVKNLPDIRTESKADVALPLALIEKWKAEGRYDKEIKELDEFFASTGWPRAPRYYVMKWHADWIRKFGFDGFRADTVKHVEPEVWQELKQVASAAYEDWKRRNPDKKLGDDKFFMTAEVFGYRIDDGVQFQMDGGTYVNFYDHGFDSLINFAFKEDVKLSYEALFSKYSAQLNGPLKGYSVLNYVSSHDDTRSFDRERQYPFETATKLLLSPGAAQIYYGDETARLLVIKDATGDAELRSFMNWNELDHNARRDAYSIAEVRQYWSKLGLFRHMHPAIGAGIHQQLADHPYTFKRTYDQNGVHDKVVVALDVPTDSSPEITVSGVFADGTRVKDYYSGKIAVVANGKVRFDSKNSVILIGLE